MSTRSLIGAVLPNGKVKFIYCHWDGDPQTMAKKLVNYYSSEERVEALLELGDISVLGKYLSPEDAGLPVGTMHSFDTPAKDVTVAYHRDRGEKGVYRGADSIDSFKHLIDVTGNSGAEFMYVYDAFSEGVESGWYGYDLSNDTTISGYGLMGGIPPSATKNMRMWNHQLGESLDEGENKEFIKPAVKLIGEDGNIFNLVGMASRALKKAGYYDQAKDMQTRVFASGSYDEALVIIGDFVEIE